MVKPHPEHDDIVERIDQMWDIKKPKKKRRVQRLEDQW